MQLVPYGRDFGYMPRIRVDYKFSIGEDGPYTGESVWTPSASLATNFNEKFGVGKSVIVRYRRTNPSVNKLDRNVWKDLMDDFVDDL